MGNLLSQYQYLVDRYSQSLTKYDVQELFERLVEIKGNNVTAATREAGIQRKTVYDWENNSEDIRNSTKRKVLDASLKNDLHRTIEFLVRKNAMNHHEILERYISMSCDEIMSINDPQEFQRRTMLFEKFIKSNSGAIHDTKTIPIEEMIDSINQKSTSLGVKGIAKDINLISPLILSQKFIHLLEIFDVKTMFKGEIADKLDLPKEFVERACRAMSYIGPSTEPEEQIMRRPERRMAKFDIQEVGLQTPSRLYYSQRYYSQRR